MTDFYNIVHRKELERIFKNASPADVDFYAKAKLCANALEDLLNEWQSNPARFNDEFSEHYPFDHSLDEVVAETYEWLESIIKAMDIRNKTYKPTITVGELKNILNQMPNDLQVTIYDEKEAAWLNIESVSFPDEQSFATLVLNAQHTFSIFQI